MLSITKAIRTTGRVNKSRGLALAEPLPWEENTPVELIIISSKPPDEEVSEAEWLRAAARNPAFDFLNDPAEDVYSPDEGVPFDEKG